MIEIKLFLEFFKIGLFTFGGGYASLPFLFDISHCYHWFSEIELTQMIAISGLTPGPVGLNMATYAGFKTLGLKGAIISSFALVLPMLIIATQVFRLLKKFSSNRYVQSVLNVLRPTSCALISYVGIKLIYNLVLNKNLNFSSINFDALFVLLILFLMTFKFKRNPVIYMSTAGIAGVIFYLCGVLN